MAGILVEVLLSRIRFAAGSLYLVSPIAVFVPAKMCPPVGVMPDRDGFYSVLRLFTGLATAALIAWTLTVSIAMAMPIKPASKNIHHCNCIR
jgi:hypothetical protein